MMVMGDRVALNKATLDSENKPVYANEVGIVVGHVRDLTIVSLDHGQNSKGGRRIATVPDGMIRLVRVAHPGKARRTRPRRYDNG